MRLDMYTFTSHKVFEVCYKRILTLIMTSRGNHGNILNNNDVIIFMLLQKYWATELRLPHPPPTDTFQCQKEALSLLCAKRQLKMPQTFENCLSFPISHSSSC